MPSLSIYLPDSIMEKVVVEAKEDDTSISKVLTKNYLSSEKVYDPTALIFDRLDLVEKKLDGINEQMTYLSGLVLGLASKSNGRKEANPEKYESHRVDIQHAKIIDDFAAKNKPMIVDAEGYDSEQEKAKLHDKNKATLSKIMDTVTEIHKSRSETKNPMSDYFKPQPKLKDNRKK